MPRDDPRRSQDVTQEMTGATAELAEPSLIAEGTRVDHFKILRLVGKGGMGEVYLARDSDLGRKVALKVLRPQALGTPQASERFLHEARTTARFSHPHIVTVHAVGEVGGRPYVALEYLEGDDLRDRLDDARPGTREAARIGLAIAQALAEAHRHGVLHRDLKPENVMIPRDGRLRVVDFGLAKAVRGPAPERLTPDPEAEEDSYQPLGAAAGGAFETRAEGIRGTPAYMAPEQWEDEPLTGAVDVWALGLILRELAVGSLPWSDTDPYAICYQACAEAPIPPLDDGATTPEMAALVARCLDKEPAARPGIAEVVDALEGMLGGGDAHRRERPPFRGLLPCDERDADTFFGRDGELDAFLERLRHEPVLPVVGASGSGKSSFVQAGVIPRLREQGPLRVLRLRPGRHPFAALAARLAAAESRAAQTARTTTLPDTGSLSSPTLETTGALVADREASEAGLKAELRATPARLALRLGQLAEAGGSGADPGRVLLFVDQLEELFTLVDDDATRRAFMEALCTAADDPRGPVRVVFTLRDDFLARLALGDAARDALSRVMVLRNPGPGALREILTRPVFLAGYEYDDPGLVEEMIAAVEGETAALPLLQFTGLRLWEARDRKGRKLLRAAHDALGGVAGALARHIDGEIDAMTSAQAATARQIFLRLVTPHGTRKVVPREALLDGLGADAGAVLDRLIAARAILVRKRDDGRRGRPASLSENGVRPTPAGADIELAHESLIQRWDRLARWIEEGRDEVAFLEEVGHAAELWRQRGERPEEAWQGDALQEALRRAAALDAMPEGIRRFLAAGERRRDRARRRRRGLWTAAVGVLVVCVVVASSLAGIYSRLQQEALRQKEEAVEGQAEALREGARAALIRGDVMEARARLRESLEARDADLSRALWWQLRRDPQIWHMDLGAWLYDVTFSPDDATVAVAGHNGLLRLIDVRSREVDVLRGLPDQIVSVEYTPDGAGLITGTFEGVALWDLEERRYELLGGPDKRNRATVSADGSIFASGGEDGTIWTWDAGSREPLRVIHGPATRINDLAFHPDGRRVAANSDDRIVRIWDVESGALLSEMPGHLQDVNALAFSPDGHILATASDDGTVRLWDMDTGELWRILPHAAEVNVVAFHPGGSVLASGADDRQVHLWDPATGTHLGVLAGHEERLRGARFSHDGRWIASVGYDHEVRLWDVSLMTRPRATRSHDQAVNGVSFHPDGETLVTASSDATMLTWDTATGQVVRAYHGHGDGVWGVDHSADGTRLASGSKDSTVRVWDTATGAQLAKLEGHDGNIWEVAFHPDGRWVASAGSDSTVRVWDVALEQQARLLPRDLGMMLGVAFSGDGERLVASGRHGVQIWDWRAGRVARDYRAVEEIPVRAARYLPGERSLLHAGNDGTLRRWDPATGVAPVIHRFDGRVHWFDVHPEGPLVGVPLSSGKAFLHDVSAGTSRVLEGHRSEINFLAFSPDGALAATTSDDGTVRLWDVPEARPYWRAPALLHDTGELLTHRGWTRPQEPDSAWIPGAEAWRDALEQRALDASLSSDGRLLAVRTHDGALQLWDRGSDELVLEQEIAGLRQVIGLADGALTLSRGGQIQRWSAGGTAQLLQSGATAMAWDGGAIWIAADRELHRHAPDGTPRGSYPADQGVTAVARVEDWIALGFVEGTLELVAMNGAPPPAAAFEDLPGSPVTRLSPGPPGILVAGFADGTLGLWSLDGGTSLLRMRLHGPVAHLLQTDQALVAVTELGDVEVLDLSVFFDDYCDILREVWDAVPVYWVQAQPVVSDPPADHPCGF